MDTLGHQELIECLSQTSGGSRSSSKPSSTGRSYASHNGKSLHSLLPTHEQSQSASRSNHARSHNTAASTAISQVDEAYRRLGQRLSSQAHGGVPPSSLGPKQVTRIVPSAESAFKSYEQRRRDAPLEAQQRDDAGVSRTTKSQKINYSDHGNHQPSNQRRFYLKNLTVNAKEVFELCSPALEPANLGKSKPESLEISSVALARLDLAGSIGDERANRKQDWMQRNPLWRVDEGIEAESSDGPWGTSSRKELPLVTGSHQTLALEPPNSSVNAKGLLSSVMEENASASSGHCGGPSHQSQTSRTISTKESSPRHHVQQQRGICLTNPAEAASNDGLDNVEGNLIVHENDIFNIPKKAIKVLQPLSLTQDAGYRVVSLLGQGTFAQVFQCIHLQTGKVVAVKIVKNKPAYTRQAGMEVDVFRALQDEGGESTSGSLSLSSKSTAVSRDYLVNLECYFFYRSHLCLVFEQLSLNLYEVLKRRQFRGLPLSVVRSIVHQVIVSLRDLSSKTIVHCDMKPENILLVSDLEAKHVIDSGTHKSPGLRDFYYTSECEDSETGAVHTEKFETKSSSTTFAKIKVIDFGSACFEGYSSHTYIQSRFYRSPEVLIGLPYDSGIDMWSLGCVAAELFLGLPILPGAHEHDQLVRITEMISSMPDWMLESGSKSPKYYLKFLAPRQSIGLYGEDRTPPAPTQETPSPIPSTCTSPAPPIPQWRLKTHDEYIRSLTSSEIQKKGGLAKLERQPGNRYFKCKRLADILSAHALSASREDKELLPSFIHFLYGLLDPDPWKRWTALQAAQHPFLTGDRTQLRAKLPTMKVNLREENIANAELSVFWQCPWDPSICRRKLLSVQKLREKQHAMRRNVSGRRQGQVADFSFLQAEKRRHSQADNCSSPARQNACLPGRFPVVRGSASPGAKPSPATSTTSSLSLAVPPATFNTSEIGPPSALQDRVVAGNRSLLHSTSDAHTGYRSGAATSLSYNRDSNLHLNLDFAFALQRPGVVPGAGSIAGDSSSVGSAAYSLSSVSHSGPDFVFEGKLPTHYPTTPSTQPLTQSNSVTSNQSGHGPYGAQPPQLLGHHHMPLAGANSSSDMSSVTMAEAYLPSARYEQHVPAHANQQFSIQERVWMEHQQMKQQQQQRQSIEWQMQPQFQPLPMQQQPVYLTSAPGGGFYYVTSSATGQPILLQPVAVLDQPITPLAAPGASNGIDLPLIQGFGQPGLNLNMVPAQMQFPIQPPPTFGQHNIGSGVIQGDYAQLPSHAAPPRGSTASRPSKPTIFRGGTSM